MREYEFMLILQPDLSDEVRDQLIERVSNWLTPGEDGEKPTVTHWGQRRLAYLIKNNREGYYVLLEAKLEPARLNQVERDILYEDNILRHLAVRKES